MLTAVTPISPRVDRPAPNLDRLEVGQEIEAGEDSRGVDDDRARSTEGVKNLVNDGLGNDAAELESVRPECCLLYTSDAADE